MQRTQNCTINEIDTNIKFELQKSILKKGYIRKRNKKEK